MTYEEASKLYDELYEEADALFKEYNPCRIEGNTCLYGRTTDDPVGKSFCCNGCDHLCERGCTVKALSCKLWLCGMVANWAPKEFLDKLQKIRDKRPIKFTGIRRSKPAIMRRIKE